MKEETYTGPILHLIQTFCFILALVLLLLPVFGTVEEVAGVRGSSKTVTLEYDEFEVSFFDFLTATYNQDSTLDIIFIVSLVANVILASILAYMTWKKILSSKKYAIVVLWLSVLPLISLILSIVIQINNSAWWVVEYTSSYSTGLYTQTLVHFPVNLIPCAIALLAGVILHIWGGILNLRSENANAELNTESECKISNFCKNCGCIVEEGSFCAKCGTSLNEGENQ